MKLEKNKPISRQMQQYVYSIKEKKYSEVYETIMLMLLNNDFAEAIDDLIRFDYNNIDETEIKESVTIEEHPLLRCGHLINEICKSKYFKDNFTENELRRKDRIMQGVLIEVMLRANVQKPDEIDKKIPDYLTVKYPLVSHTEKEAENQILLTFDKDTPLNDAVGYIKEVVGLKNKPKKRKLSLGKSLRILMADQRVKDVIDQIDEPYEYIEQLTAKEYNQTYNENISIEDVQKSLQRIRKIKREINTVEQDK